MDEYPAVSFMVRHGRRLSVVVGLLPLLGALLGIVVANWGPWAVLAGAVAGLVLGFVFRTFAELTQIIADMLLPQ